MKIKRIHLKIPQIHVMPEHDPYYEHSVSLLCTCNPDIEEVGQALVVVHHMQSGGPDRFVIEVANYNVGVKP